MLVELFNDQSEISHDRKLWLSNMLLRANRQSMVTNLLIETLPEYDICVLRSMLLCVWLSVIEGIGLVFASRIILTSCLYEWMNEWPRFVDIIFCGYNYSNTPCQSSGIIEKSMHSKISDEVCIHTSYVWPIRNDRLVK